MKNRKPYSHLGIFAISLFLLLEWSGSARAQNATPAEYQVKAVFLYNFTKFIDWPSTVFRTPSDPFIIGIIGNDPFGSYLDETVAGEKFGTHPIQVKRFSDAHSASDCQILYIGSHDQEFTKRVLSEVASKSVLTVSDIPSYYRWEGIVRFVTENNKIRLHINLEQSRASDLVISSKLLSVAKTN